MTEDVAFTDPSCYHAALGTLLLDHRPGAAPALVIGNATRTGAARDEVAARFSDPIAALELALSRRGHRLTQSPLMTRADHDTLVNALAEGRAVIAEVDTFHLAHYWMDFGRVHSVHTVVLRDLDNADGTVRLTDPVDVAPFDGRVPLRDLDGALRSDVLSKSWMAVEFAGRDGTPTPRQLNDELAYHAENLSGAGDGSLSGVELTAVISHALDELLDRARLMRRPESPDRDDPERQWISDFLMGMWDYHHILRWFAAHLGLVLTCEPAVKDRLVGIVDDCAQDWLTARTLLMRSAASSTAQTPVYRKEIADRLDRADRMIRESGDTLRSLSERVA